MEKMKIEWLIGVPNKYDWIPQDKEQWHRLMMQYAREIAKLMGLSKGEFEVRSNKAGPAVLGDVYLHTEFVHVCFGQGYGQPATFYYRGCVKGGFKNRDSGTGMSGVERNINVPYETLMDMDDFAYDLQQLTEKVKAQLQAAAA